VSTALNTESGVKCHQNNTISQPHPTMTGMVNSAVLSLGYATPFTEIQ